MAFDPDAYLKERGTDFNPDAYLSEVKPPDIDVTKPENSSFVKRTWGSLMKGGMKLGQAALELPVHTVKLAERVQEELIPHLKDMPRWETPKGYQWLIDAQKRGQQAIIKRHPEWEYDPPENFLDLLTSPDKLTFAITESLPVMVGAGIVTAAGRPDVAYAMMYGVEGQEAHDQAIAYGTTEEEAETAYHLYGSISAALEYAQLKGIMKISKKAFNRVTKRTAQKLVGKSLTKEIILETATQALQEDAQGAWGEATAKLIYDRPVEGGLKGFVDRRAQEALIAGTMGLIPGLGGAVTGVVTNKASGRTEKITELETLKSQVEESDISENGKNKLLEEFDQIIQNVSEGKFNIAEPGVTVESPTEALPADQQDAANTLKQFKTDAVIRSQELQQMEYEELLTLAQDGDELAAWRIGEIDAENALEAGLPKFEVLFGEMLEGNEAAKNAIYNGEYQGGRSRQKALETDNRVDPAVEATDDQIRNFATIKVHALAKLMKVNRADRQRIQQDIVGKKSMKNMDMEESKRVEAYFVAEAKKRGLTTSTGKELASVIKEHTTQKKVQELSGTKPVAWKRMLQTPGKVVSQFFHQTKRVERLLEALDGFTEGPIYNSIWTSVHTALVGSRTSYTNRVGKFKEALVEIMTPELNTEEGMIGAIEAIQAEEEKAGKKARKLGKRAVRKLVGDSLWARHITSGREVILEATETNPELSLNASERIGMYLAMKNEDSRAHLFAGNLAVFDNPALAALEVVQKMSTEEKQIGDWILADLTANFERANQAAVIGLGRTLDEQDNYFPINVVDVAELQSKDFLSLLEDKYTKQAFKAEPAETKERVKGADQPLDLDSFGVYLGHMKRIEQFVHMAPVAKSVGNILNTREFRQAINNKTSGHGSGILDRWLKNSIRGHAVDPQTGLAAKTMLWMRQRGVLFSLARNIPSVARQFISGFNAAATHPTVLAYAAGNIAKSVDPRYYKQLEKRMRELSPEMETRSFERYLANAKHQAKAAKMLVGKKGWSEKALSWQRWADRRTVVTSWNAFYDSAIESEAVQKQFDLDGSDEAAIAFANKMVGRTQPMGDVEHLPDFFTGGAIERLLSTFQNQVNNNWNFWAHDIYGMRKAGKISKKMVAYRVLFSNILPSMMFGAISRGGLPDDWKDVVFDWAAYSISPIFLLGRLAIDAVLGFAGGQTSVEDILPSTASKTIGAAIRKDPAKVALYGLKTVGGLTGRIPNQAIRTGQGIYDIQTGETDDLRRLIYSDWSLTKYGWPGDKDDEDFFSQE